MNRLLAVALVASSCLQPVGDLPDGGAGGDGVSGSGGGVSGSGGGGVSGSGGGVSGSGGGVSGSGGGVSGSGGGVSGSGGGGVSGSGGGGVSGSGGGGVSGSGGGVSGSGGGVTSTTLTPAAPSTTRFEWQGQQRAFNGTSCVGKLAFAVGATAVCYGHSDGTMRCAGRVATIDFGRAFSSTTERDVAQIFISRNVGASMGPAQGICVRHEAGTAACIGSYNWNGQYGAGDLSPKSTFTRWGTAGDIVGLATGTWDQFCALHANGAITCSGYMFGTSPSMQGLYPMATRMYVNEFGQAVTGDANVFRVSNGRSSCRVGATGLICNFGMVPSGTAGTVVDGFRFGPPGPIGEERCWLDDAGRVYCTTGPKFTALPVLAIAADFDTTSVCAVLNDGSLWCLGSNEEGKLGTGGTSALTVETQVQPPGSVRIGCP